MNALLITALAAATAAPIPMLERVVVVASRSEQPAGDIAGSVSLIERETLDRYLVKDIADLVRYEPGLSAPEDASRFGLQGFAIRGLSGNRVGIEIDGVPVADGFAIGSFSNAGRSAMETDFLQRAEILRGPASTLYGSDALGGVVSLSTLDASDLLDDQQRFGARLRTGVAGADDSHSASAVLGWQQGSWRALAGQVYRRGHERENLPRPGGLASNPAERHALASLFKLGYSADAAEYRLSYDRFREATQTDVQSLVRGPGQYASTTALLGDDLFRRERLSLTGDWQWQARGFERLQAVLHSQRSGADQDTSQTRAAAPPRTPPTLRERNFLLDTEVRGLRLQGEGRFSWGRARHWQVFGIDYARTDLSELRDARETNLLTGVATDVLIGERFPLRDFPNSHTQELGLFWQDEIRWGEHFALIPGLRYEHFQLRPEPDALFQARNPTVVPVSIDTDQLTPKLGLRYQITQGLQVFAQYALGFRAPPVSDVNIGFTIPAFNYRAIPNPELRPEHSRGVEFGLRMSDGWGSAELAVFDNRYRDLIDSRVNLGSDASGSLIFQSINRSRARIRGVEARAELGLPVDTLSLHGALAWSHGDDLVLGVPLNSVEPGKLTLGLVWEPNAAHRLELVGTAVAGKRRIDHGNRTLFAAPGYGLLDAYWSWQLGERWTLDVAARNLGDRRYWLWSGVRGLAAHAREVDLFTQPGRSFALNLGYRF